jgi:hypothetical protein
MPLSLLLSPNFHALQIMKLIADDGIIELELKGVSCTEACVRHVAFWKKLLAYHNLVHVWFAILIQGLFRMLKDGDGSTV